MQTADISFVGAMLVGLLGSTHCLGMCGGIVSALSFGLDESVRRSPWRVFPYLLTYNIGRITSYLIAGGIAGAAGATVFGIAPTGSVRVVLWWLSAGCMIALGLYLAGWWPGLQQLEKWGGALWKHIEPYGRSMMPVNHPLKALVLGMVWGWLPCGMVYAVLAWSLAAGSASQGAMLMLGFGLGTLPMMLAVGATADGLRGFVRNVWVRRATGILVIAFGISILISPADHRGHSTATTISGHHH